jgi:hypothetical protein
MSSTADGAATPHVEINIRLRHHITVEQNYMQSIRQPHRHTIKKNVKETPRFTTTGNELKLL